MQKKLYRAPKGKQAKLADDTMGYSMNFSHEVAIEKGTGFKPIASHSRGIEVILVDGNHPGLHLIFPRTTDVE